MTSIIFINYNVANEIEESLTILSNSEFQIIIADNSPPEAEYLKNKFDITYISLPNNPGFGAANNTAAKAAKGDVLLFINPDVLISGENIHKLQKLLLSNDKIGAVGPILKTPEGKLERYYSFFPSLYSRFTQEFKLYQRAPIMKYKFTKFWDKNISNGKPFKVDWVMGACLMMKKVVFENSGGFDEAFFLFEEETELQYRLSKEGYEFLIDPSITAIHNHHSSVSQSGVLFRLYQEYRSRIIFHKKHDKGIKKLIRFIFLFLGIVLRYVFYSTYSIFNKKFNSHKLAYKDLILFSFKRKEDVIKDRFNNEKYKQIFSQ